MLLEDDHPATLDILTEPPSGYRLKGRARIALQHSNTPIQPDIWGREVIFRGKGQTTIYGYPLLT